MDRARWVKLGFVDLHGNPDISHDILRQERVCMNTTFLQHGGYHMLTPAFHFCVLEHKATESTPGLFETLIIKPRVFSSLQLVLTGICHLSWPLGRRGYGQVRISHEAQGLEPAYALQTLGLTCLQCLHLERRRKRAGGHVWTTPFAS